MKDILIIGFGASSLNVRALLSGSYKHTRSVYYLDSMDSSYVESVLDMVDLGLCDTYIISKSGATYETNLLAKLILEMGARNIKVICGNKESELAKIVSSVKHEWIDFVGEKSGRFALLTKPFLDIAESAGIDTTKLMKGAEDVDNDDENYINRMAEKWLKHFEERRRIWVIMLYVKQLHGLFMWIRQIVAESLGKEGWGILPFLCEGSMDEHSQLQLFLDGPKDKFYDIITCDYSFLRHSEEGASSRPSGPHEVSNELDIPPQLQSQDPDAYAHKLRMTGQGQTLHAEKVAHLLKAKKLPYEFYQIEEVDAYVVGQYIATYLKLVKVLGAKLGFDPMNQPAVESMKKSAHEN